MDDHGWGDTGGPAEGRANAGEKAPNGVAPRETAANVVPFPRDWIGPLEELVPIDTGTNSDEQGDAGVDPAVTDEAPGFWDGDIAEARSAPAPAWDERAPAKTGVPPEPEAGPAVGGSRRLGHAARSEPRRPRKASSTRSSISAPRGPGRALVVCVVALLSLAAVAAVLVFTGGLSRSTRDSTSALAGGRVKTLTETVTTSGVTNRPVRARSTDGRASKAKESASGQGVRSKSADTSSRSSGGTDGTPTGRSAGSVGDGRTSGGGAGDGSPTGSGEPGTSGSGSASVPVAAGTSGISTGATGSACAQSPNSGCLP